MELKAGYKQTEVGVIPEDWEVKALKEISPRQSVGLVINPSTYFDPNESIPMLVGSSVTENRIDAEAANRISAASNSKLAASRLTQGDLVTVRVGDPGVTAVVPPELDQCNCASMMIVRQDRSFNSHWLCSTMNSRHGRQQVENVQYGTAQKQFNIKDAVNFIYAVPPLQEQNQIATVLSEVELLLMNLEQVITKKRNIKQAAMQELLTGKRRLPGFEGDWEVKRLGEVGEIRSGGTPSTSQPQFWDGNLPWCTPTDITALHGRKYLTKTAHEISTAGLQSSSAEVIPPHSLIMTSRATIGECAINLIPMTTNQGFKNIIPFTGVDVEFLYYLMTTQKQGLIALCGGSTFLEIGKKQLSVYEIRLPTDRSEQAAIAATLSDMDTELIALEDRRVKTGLLKQGMMQELLTGKTRLVKLGVEEVLAC